jgi:hypothetical protein
MRLGTRCGSYAQGRREPRPCGALTSNQGLRRGDSLHLRQLLDRAASPAHLCLARRPDGRCRFAPTEESPGSKGKRCRPTAGEGDLRDSATENKPPAQGSRDAPRARAKRCGKSAPRPWQQGRQGKPHREQDRIGAAAPATAQGFPARRPGWSHEARRKTRPRGMVVPRQKRGQNPAYRPSGVVISTPSHSRATDPQQNESGICVPRDKRLGQNRAITAKPLTNARKIARQQSLSRSFPFDAHAVPCYPMASRNGGPAAHGGT